jgi:hypothetical protein
VEFSVDRMDICNGCGFSWNFSGFLWWILMNLMDNYNVHVDFNGYLHYHKSKVHFVNLNHYGTLQMKINLLHFTDFTLIKIISL